MSAFAANPLPQVSGFTQRNLDRQKLRSYHSHPTNPSQRHNTAIAAAADPTTSSQPSLQSTTKAQDGDKAKPGPMGRRTGAPDWNEFYKNGLPSEVIVIEDTPEPDPNGSIKEVASYHIIAPTIPPNSAAKKRKYEDDSSSISTSAKISSNQSLQASSKSTPYDVPSPSTSSKDARAAKKRRTRGQNSADRDGTRQVPSVVGYQGLSKPPVKARDVAVRRIAPGAGNRRVDDDDGHYIIVPDSHVTNQFQIKRLIGQGTFGKVVQARDLDNTDSVAIKIIRSVQKYRDAAKIELRVLQTLRQNDPDNKYKCIHLRDCFDFQGHICIVTELLGCSLFDFLKGNGFVPFPNSHIQSFAKQLLTSVAFLHDIGIVHTDLKPENILLKDEKYQTFTYHRNIPTSRTSSPRQANQRKVLLGSEIRLIDFGSATFNDEYHSSVVSTRHYRAPEIIMGLGWSYPCDIWSIGCILVEFYTGDALFHTHDNIEHLAMMEAVFDTRIDPDLVRQVNKSGSKSSSNPATYFKRLKLNYPTPETTRGSRRFVRAMKKLTETIPSTSSFLRNFLDLLQKMFAYDPSRRITAKDALLHPFFQIVLRDDGTEAARIALEKAQRSRAVG
uniref:Protein kinase domain-containing protein n=2 Tax=Bionectria ochroleuca TaxID=29856 RepID=A0A0B7JNJ0_BIOOC